MIRPLGPGLLLFALAVAFAAVELGTAWIEPYGPSKPIEDLLSDWRYFGLPPSPKLRANPES